MADVHESLIRSFRKRVIRGGLKETKSPMPSYRPDIFAQRLAQNGSIVEQLAVEAEIASTLFSEHTAEQLLKMHEFMISQKTKRIKVRGFLIIPKGKSLAPTQAWFCQVYFPRALVFESFRLANKIHQFFSREINLGFGFDDKEGVGVRAT